MKTENTIYKIQIIFGFCFAAALIIMAIMFGSCSKDNPAPSTSCKTCDVNVKYKHTDRITGHTQTDVYVESSKEYCNDSWKDVDGESHTWSGSNTQYSYYQYIKTTSCH